MMRILMEGILPACVAGVLLLLSIPPARAVGTAHTVPAGLTAVNTAGASHMSADTSGSTNPLPAMSSMAMVTSHSITLNGLTVGQTHYYKVNSNDGKTSATSAQQTFTAE